MPVVQPRPGPADAPARPPVAAVRCASISKKWRLTCAIRRPGMT